MRIVFLGSPPFALPSLRALRDEYSVEALVCQPDRKAGRGRQPTPPATKVFANEVGIPVFQPERIRDAESLETIGSYGPDLIVVAAYGQILPQALLDIAENGSLNVHASLLPRWRGAAPIQAAIRSGDDESGVTIMQMDAGLDTGPIISRRSIRLEGTETGGSLSEKLALIGAELLAETLPGYLDGDTVPQPQDESLATYAPMLKKADGALDFSQPADSLERQVRGYDPWPGTFIAWDDRRLAVKQASTVPDGSAGVGEVVMYSGTPAVGTASGLLLLETVQPAGRREMSGADFVRGSTEFIGTSLLL